MAIAVLSNLVHSIVRRSWTWKRHRAIFVALLTW
jgi:hypothetical protein